MKHNDETPANKQAKRANNLERGLKNRHIQLIALGGAIGVGLFLGSAKAIHQAGPALIISYAIAGVALFFMMRALGELLLYRPIAGSFTTYAEEYVGRLAGFFTGWTYWFMWVLVGMAELTAIGVYTHYWFANVPQWIPALAALIILTVVNLIAVKLFGEFEFWFALIKIFTIVGMILLGLGIILFGFSDLGPSASFSNLWSHGGFSPVGAIGILLTVQIACFSYTGIELIGVTAGETENPEKVLPQATNGVIYRILFFYIGTLLIIMSLVPWNQLNPTTSPFVQVFDRVGIPAAGGIINFVVITAAASSCNSGIFSTGRMLYTLAHFRQAPLMFAKLNRRRVPASAILLSSACMLIGVVLNYLVPEEVFTYITSIVTVAAVWTWGIIVWSHLNYRHAVDNGLARQVSYRLPGAPYSYWFVLLFLFVVVCFLGLEAETRVALYVAPVWFALLTIGYRLGVKPARVR